MCMKTVGKWKGIRHVEMAYEDGRKDVGCSGLLSARARVSGDVECREASTLCWTGNEDRVTS
jgi:hypothetical protein